MVDPNIVDPEYNAFISMFDGSWPTNLEFFHAARKFERDKIHAGLHKVEILGDYDYYILKKDYKELFSEYD